jgi:predicted nuclease of predicted toxin-antitoxin system
VKVLLDENLPHALRIEIMGHEVFTTQYLGWTGIENGTLLAKAATEGFDVVVTNDRGLEYQQNLHTLPVSVVVLIAQANTIEAIRPLLLSLHNQLRTLSPRTFIKIDA